MAWLRTECPVIASERAWIEENLQWFVAQFGDDWLRTAVVVPTDDFFPGAYTGSDSDVHDAVTAVCGYMGVDPERVVVEFHGENRPESLASGVAGTAGTWKGTAGHYHTVNGRAVVSLDDSLRPHPLKLIATIAHELAHERLLGEERITRDRNDGEPLTDLLTVFLGLGVFGANAALEAHTSRTLNGSRWSTSRLGYLTEPMFGYALARYAWMRGEADPDWIRHVDANPRSALKKGLRFLKQSA